MTERIAIIGLGYVGLPIALRAVEAGYDVVGVEVDPTRFQSLVDQRSYVEDITDAGLSEAFRSERFHVVQAIGAIGTFDIAVITVPTPLREGAPDLTFVEIASKEVAGVLRSGNCVILESTTYPGTTEDLMVPLLEEHSGHAPESTSGQVQPGAHRPGQPTMDHRHHAQDHCRASMANRLNVSPSSTPTSSSALFRSPARRSPSSPSFSKPRIATSTLLSSTSWRLRPQSWASTSGKSSMRRQSPSVPSVHPGPGVGGHCLPIDPSYLSWQVKRQLATRSDSSSWPTTSTSTCPTTWLDASCWRSTMKGGRSKALRLLLISQVLQEELRRRLAESPAVRVAELLATSAPTCGSWIHS